MLLSVLLFVNLHTATVFIIDDNNVYHRNPGFLAYAVLAYLYLGYASFRTKALSQKAYNDRYDGLVRRYEKALAKLEKLNAEKVDRENREREILGFIDSLQNSPLALGTWDEQLWTLLVVKGTVSRDGGVEFEFMGGVVK